MHQGTRTRISVRSGGTAPTRMLAGSRDYTPGAFENVTISKTQVDPSGRLSAKLVPGGGYAARFVRTE